MVRRGSTVRVRQRALQKPRNRGFLCRRNLHEFQYAMGMEPFMELSDPERPLGVRDGGAHADLDEAACVDAGLSSAPDQSYGSMPISSRKIEGGLRKPRYCSIRVRVRCVSARHTPTKHARRSSLKAASVSMR